MFTGIVESVGEVVELRDQTLVVRSDISDLSVGDSISVMGVCLTVTKVIDGRFELRLSEETLRRSNLGDLKTSSLLNLELPMKPDTRFGGHIVQGHVDGVARVVEKKELPGSTELTFDLGRDLLAYVVEKGSIALDGVSLTVSALHPSGVTVSLIPHTLATTTLSRLEEGDSVNVEVDVLAKHVERLMYRDEGGSI
jgi:riboflavin synthase